MKQSHPLEFNIGYITFSFSEFVISLEPRITQCTEMNNCEKNKILFSVIVLPRLKTYVKLRIEQRFWKTFDRFCNT